jgi:hypothetical protein
MGRPACSACTRRGDLCIYGRSKDIGDSVRQQLRLAPKSSTKATDSSRRGSPLTGYDEAEHNIYTTAAYQQTLGGYTFFQSHEKEMLHGWVAEGYAAMSENQSEREFWRVGLPTLALRHHFLLQAFFAVLTLYQAFRMPDKQGYLVQQANIYFSRCLFHFRPQLEAPNDKNRTALFHCAAVIGCFLLARYVVESRTETADPPVTVLRHLLYVWRGSACILRVEDCFSDQKDFSLEDDSTTEAQGANPTTTLGTSFLNPSLAPPTRSQHSYHIDTYSWRDSLVGEADIGLMRCFFDIECKFASRFLSSCAGNVTVGEAGQ